MQYIKVKEAAQQWGVTVRRVQDLAMDKISRGGA